MVYACDHEPFSETLWHDNPALSRAESIVHEGDRRHARFMAGADMVIHDAQYTPEEYPSKKTWGPSTFECGSAFERSFRLIPARPARQRFGRTQPRHT